MLSVLWAKFSKWIVGAAAAIVFVLSIFYAGRKSGESKAESDAAKQRADDREALATRKVNEIKEDAKRQVETLESANDVKTKNSSLSDTDVNDKLRSDWQRD